VYVHLHNTGRENGGLARGRIHDVQVKDSLVYGNNARRGGDAKAFVFSAVLLRRGGMRTAVGKPASAAHIALGFSRQ